jgi:hypothetical protein
MSAPPIQHQTDAARATDQSSDSSPDAPARFPSFADLIAPLNAQTFFASHWESSPVHVARSSPDHYRALFTAADLDFVVTLGCQLHNSSIELLGTRANQTAGDARVSSNAQDESDAQDESVARVESIAPRFPENVTTVFAAYRAGASVRVIGAHRYWKPLWTLCRELQNELSFPVRANLYCTPPDARGAELHYDTHDVFVLQIAGRKRWRVYRPLDPLALAHLPTLAFERAGDVEFRRGAAGKRRVGIDRGECGEPLIEAALEAGDLLYVPRAFVHEAACESESSIHASIGVHALTWTDALAVALGRRAMKDERLRTSLPVGFARGEGRSEEDEREDGKIFRQLLEDFARDAYAADTLSEIAANALWDQQSLCDGALFDSRARVEIEATTLVERRPGLNLKLVRDAQTVALHAGHATFNAPAPLVAALEFVARMPRFRVSEIAGGLSDAGKIALARRLIGEGFLRVVTAG